MGFNVVDVAFGLIDNNGNVTFTLNSGAYNQDLERFKQDIKLLQSLGIKVVLALGGGGAHWTGLSSEQNITNFVNSLISLVNEYGFDGVDLDNEDSGMLGSQTGIDYYKSAIIALRGALGEDKILTITPFAVHVYDKTVGNAQNDYVSGAFNLYRKILKDRQVMSAIDAVQVMAYNDWIGGCNSSQWTSQACQKGSQEYLE